MTIPATMRLVGLLVIVGMAAGCGGDERAPVTTRDGKPSLGTAAVGGTYLVDLDRLDDDFQRHLDREIMPWITWDKPDGSRIIDKKRLKDTELEYERLRADLKGATLVLHANGTYRIGGLLAWGPGGATGRWRTSGRDILLEPPVMAEWPIPGESVVFRTEGSGIRGHRISRLEGKGLDFPFSPYDLLLVRRESSP